MDGTKLSEGMQGQQAGRGGWTLLGLICLIVTLKCWCVFVYVGAGIRRVGGHRILYMYF